MDAPRGHRGHADVDANLGTPQFVDKRLVWMTPEWKERFATPRMKLTGWAWKWRMAAAGGWSETGGPWVKPKPP